MATGTIQKDMVLLWENPNPASAFGAQTIQIDLSGYAFAAVFIRSFADSDADSGTVCGIIPVGMKGAVYFGGTSSGMNGRRIFTPTSTGVEFSNGRYGSSERADVGIPVRIYGIKA